MLDVLNQTTEKSYKFSNLDQLKNILKESGWKNDEFTRFFGSSGVTDPFKERTLTESQLKTLAKKLDDAKTQYEQRALLRQITMGNLVEDIGTVYSFTSITELSDALKQRGVIYPADYLQQPGSTFVTLFVAPRHLAKARYDKLIEDLAKISGSSYQNNADRGEIIRAAFGDVGLASPSATVPTTSTTINNPPESNKDTKKVNADIKAEAEKMKDINISSLRTFMDVTDKWVIMLEKIDKPSAIATRGLIGTLILEKLSGSGYECTIAIPNNVVIGSIDPTKGATVDIARQLSVALSGNNSSVENIKYGLLFRTSQFEKFVEANYDKSKNAFIENPMLDYPKYLRGAYKDDPKKYTKADQMFLMEPESILTSLDVKGAILASQQLGNVSQYIEKNPDALQGVLSNLPKVDSNTPASPTSAPSNNSTPNGPIQNGANAVAGTAGTFAGKTAENIGDFAGGVSQALSKGFEKGGAIGGLAVTVIGIMGAWKFLTGEWGTKNHKLSGWMIALLGFGGKAAYDMASEYGLIDKTKDAAGNVVKKAKAKVEGTTDSKTSSESADVDPDKTRKTVSKTVETQNLTGSQIEASKNVENHVDLKKSLDGKTPGMSEYLNFVNKELSGVAMEKFINDTDSSIFAPGTTIDPAIKANLGTMNPITLKKVLRAYLGANVILSISSGKQPGVVEKENFMKEKIHPKGLNADTYTKTKTLSDLTSIIYSSSKVESTNLSPEVIQKIKSYTIVHNGKALPKDNLDISVDPEMCDDKTYEVTITVKNPKEINKKADKIDPILVYFDKAGKLITTNLEITGCAVILGQQIPDASSCQLKHEGNQIVISEIKK